MKIGEEVGIDGMSEGAVGHLLGCGRVPDPVQPFGQLTDELVMLRGANGTTRDRLS